MAHALSHTDLHCFWQQIPAETINDLVRLVSYSGILVFQASKLPKYIQET